MKAKLWTTVVEDGDVLIVNPEGDAVAHMNASGDFPLALQKANAEEMLEALNRSIKGGSAKSKAKAKASAQNGKLGGRPKKSSSARRASEVSDT